MKKNYSIQHLIAVLITVLAMFPTIVAQNLIDNQSFETNDGTCNFSLGAIDQCSGATPIGSPTDWYSPTDGSPDYFATCSTDPTTSVPYNAYGAQSANTGGAYAGFFAYGPNNFREYVALNITPPLSAGTTYCVNFNVSLADYTCIGVQQIGAYFSTGTNCVSNSSLNLGFTPQIINTTEVLTDKLNWVTIGGTYTPSATVNQIIIGNFNDNASTTTAPATSTCLYPDYSYYFLDNVSIIEVGSIAITPSAVAPYCASDNITLTATPGSGNYEWTNIHNPFTVLSNSNQLNLFPIDSATHYVLKINDGDCIRYDTVFVDVLPIPKPNFTYNVACNFDGSEFIATLLDASQNISDGSSFQWDINADGTINATNGGGTVATFLSAGIYPVKLSITNATGCVADTTIEVIVSGICNQCSQPYNIVPNYSFEEYLVCPDNAGQISYAIPWSSPTNGSPDYFNTCANQALIDAPQNFYGNQTAATGNAYAGIALFGAPVNNREYLYINLNQTLEAGRTYCVKFKASHADSSQLLTANLGLAFADNSIYYPSNAPLSQFGYTPSIQNTNGIIGDEWTTISGNYVASGTENYLIIGNFEDDGNTITIPSDNYLNALINMAYYYIDDVEVMPLPNLDLSGTNDTITTCINNPTIAYAFSTDAADFCQYTWTDLDNNNDTIGVNFNIPILATTADTLHYQVSATYGNCIVSDTLVIIITPTPQAGFIPYAACAGGVSYFIDTTKNVLAGASYFWDFESDGIIDATAKSPAHIFTSSDTSYVVRLIVSNQNPFGCVDTFEYNVLIGNECNPCSTSGSLVINAGFEDNTACPNNINQISNANFWTSVNNGQAPNDETDYFNACGNSIVGVPQNNIGNEAAHGGNGYGGFIAYIPASPNYREYITGQVPALTAGATYCLRMYVSLADSSRFAVDQLGAYLTNIPYDGSTPQNPQVNNAEFNIISTKNGWVEIGGSFVAVGGEQYLSIGNFSKYNTNVTSVVGAGTVPYAYYFVDDITLSEINAQIVQTDTALCYGSTLMLNANSNACSIYWTSTANPNNILSLADTLLVTITDTVQYVFHANNGTCAVTDTIKVTMLPLPSLTVSNDTFMCQKDTIQLAVSGADVFSWYPNIAITDTTINNPKVYPDTTTMYYLIATNSTSGCTIVDSVLVIVNPLPTVFAGNDIAICTGDSAQISLIVTNGAAYKWTPSIGLSNDSIPNPKASPADTTQYIVQVTSPRGCVAFDTINIYPTPPYAPLPTDTLIYCAGSPVQVNLANLPADAVTFAWYPNFAISDTTISNPLVYPNIDTLYTLTYTNIYGCSGTVNLKVLVAPVPNTGSDLQICDGGSILLSVSTADTYNWTVVSGDFSSIDSLATLRNPGVSPTQTTTYAVQVTYNTYPAGASCPLSDTVTVVVSPTNFADAGANVIICEGDSTQLNAIGGNTYTWSPSIGLSDANIANPTASPTTTTTYYVTVLNTITQCTSIDSVTVSVIPIQTPNILVTDTLIFCAAPLEFVDICYGLNYNGCENLLPDVQVQLPSQIQIISDTCFRYRTSYSTGNVDTLIVSVCTNKSNLCDSFVAIVINCDQAPNFDATAAITDTTIVNFPIEVMLPNASDPDLNDVLTNSVTSPINGTVTLTDSSVVYTPFAGFIGIDSFLVIVCDSLPLVQCDTVQYFIVVEPDNNQAPSFNDTIVNVFPGQSTIICLHINDPEGDAYTTDTLSSNYNGSITLLNSENCLVYTPNPNNPTNDTIFIVSCDIYNHCQTDTLIVNVLPAPNQAPVVNDTLVSTLVNSSIIVCLDVSDPEGNSFTSTVTNSANQGFSIVFSNNCFIYQPNNNFIGLDTVEIDVCDIFNNCTSVTTIINVVPPPNQNPVVPTVLVTTPYQQAVGICIGIVDPDGDNYNLSIIGNPNYGNVQLVPNNDSCLVYYPNPDFYGTDTIDIQVCDDLNNCTNSSVIIFVLQPPTNNAPIAQDTILFIDYNTSTPICLNILEPDNDPYLLTIFDNGNNGNATILNNDCINYTPFNNFIGNDTITVSVCDDQNLCDLATVIISINSPQNDLPLVPSVIVTTPTNQQVSVCLQILDPENNPTTTIISGLPNNGNVIQIGDSCFTYQPNLNFNGIDTIIVTVCDAPNHCTNASIIVIVNSPLNDPPIAPPVFTTTTFNTQVSVCLGIFEPEGESYTLQITGPASNGNSLALNSDCIQYTPNTGFSGIDIVTINVCDASGNCTSTTATILVLSPNNQTPIVSDPSATTPYQTTTTLCFNINDDDNTFNYTTINPFDNGNGSLNGNCVTYTPNNGFSGVDVIEILVCDPSNACDTATVTINVGQQINLPPVVPTTSQTTPYETDILVCVNITDPNNDTYTTSIIDLPNIGSAILTTNNCVNYSPNNNVSGNDTIVIKSCDSFGACSTGIIVITVLPPTNLPPVVPNVSITTPFNVDVTPCLSITDPDGDPTTITITDQPNNGLATIVNNCILYNPNNTFNGTDIIQVSVCDDNGACTTAFVNITVLPSTNQAPTAQQVQATIACSGTPVISCITATDPDGDPLTYTVLSITPNAGTATIVNTNCVQYVAANTFGTITVKVNVCDDNAACITVDVPFTATNTGVLPTVLSENKSTQQNTPLTITPNMNNINSPTITITQGAANGSSSLNNGNIVYQPNPTFVGTDTIEIKVCNLQGACDLAPLCDVATYVIAVNDALIANDDVDLNAEDNNPLVINYLNNDIYSVLCNNPVQIITAPSNGVVILNNNGTFTYIANEGFVGVDIFEYQICDTNLGIDVAQVVVNVTNNIDAIADIANTCQNAQVTINTLDNDVYTNIYLDTLIDGGIPNSAVTFDILTGVLTYFPAADFAGKDTLKYVICSNNLGCDTALVIINILPTAINPTANNDASEVFNNTTVTNNVISNDVDLNTTGTLTVTNILQPSNGTAILNLDGTITYNPNDTYVGTDTITYTICDVDVACGNNVCANAIWIITVKEDQAQNCDPVIYGTFSPNGDAYNESFEIDNLDCAENVKNSLLVFNRWGNVVYKADNYVSGTWKGTLNESDKELPDGTYFYILKIPAKDYEKQGYVEIAR